MTYSTDDQLTNISDLVSPTRAHHLATQHILAVFSNVNSEPLSEVFADLYLPDVTIHENDGSSVSGHDGVRKLVAGLVGKGGKFEGWKFVLIGEVKLNKDFVMLHWGFGPEIGFGEGNVDVKVTGADGLLLEKDSVDGLVRIKTNYVIIDGLSDAKPS